MYRAGRTYSKYSGRRLFPKKLSGQPTLAFRGLVEKSLPIFCLAGETKSAGTFSTDPRSGTIHPLADFIWMIAPVGIWAKPKAVGIAKHLTAPTVEATVIAATIIAWWS